MIPIARSAPPPQLDLHAPSTLSGTNGPLSWLDLNGDGAEDLIDFPSTAWLNRGGVFTSMPITGASLGLHPNRYGAIRVGDFDHDGRDELLYPATVQKGWCHLYGTSSAEPLEYCTTGLVNFDASGAPSHLDHTLYGWNLLDLELDLASGAFVRSTRPTNLIAPLNRMWPGDHRGDGLLDVQYRIGFSYGEVSPGNVAPLGRYESSEGPGTFVARHDGPAPDLLVLATDGLGMTSSVAYAPLSAVGHPTCVAAGAAPLYEANRVGVEADGVHRLFTSSMYVVARIEREDGIGGKRGTCFQYENAWWHGLGRDFVGFEAIAERDHVPTDAGNDLVRTTRYHTRAPLIGRAWETTTGRADDPPGTAPLRLESSLWDARCVDSVDGAPAQACFPFVAETSAVENDLTTRTELSRKTTTSIYAPADLVYGNPTEVVEVVQHGHGFDSVRTVMAYDYAFVADWWIAKPTQKTVTLSTGTGPGQTRQVVTTYEHWEAGSSFGLPSAEHVQPGHATQALRRTLFYDNYGNPNLIREEAALAPARQTRHDYTGDGYFLRATKNPALHTTSQEIDPKTGNVTLVEDANGQKTELVYDAMGRPLEERSLGTQGGGPKAPPIYTRLVGCGACPPNVAYRRVTVQAGAPRITEYFDHLDRVIRTQRTSFSGGDVHVFVHYDGRGRKVAESRPTFEADPSSAPYVRFEDFDPLGRPRRKVLERPDHTGFELAVVTYAHNGLSTTIELPGGGTLVRARDAVGRLRRSVDQAGAVTEYGYDPLGELETILDPELHTIRNVRDDRGRLLTAMDPNAGTRTFGGVLSCAGGATCAVSPAALTVAGTGLAVAYEGSKFHTALLAEGLSDLGGSSGPGSGRGSAEALKDFSKVATRTTRDGGRGVRLTRQDGSVVDITSKRVKEFVRSTHPSAPPGTIERVKFPNAQPGTKGFKRDPTPDELRLLEEAFK